MAYHGLLKQGTIYSGGDQLQFSGGSVAYHGLLKQGTYLQWWWSVTVQWLTMVY